MDPSAHLLLSCGGVPRRPRVSVPISFHIRPFAPHSCLRSAPKRTHQRESSDRKRNNMEQNGTLFRLGSLVHPPDSGPESAFPGGRKETPAIRIAAPAASHSTRPPVPQSDTACHDAPTPHRRRALRVRGRAGTLRLCPPLAVVEYGRRRPRMVRGLVLQEGNQGGDCDG